MKKIFLSLFILFLCLSNVAVFGATSSMALQEQIDQQNQKIDVVLNELSGFKADFSGFKSEYKDVNQQYKDVVSLSSDIIDKGLNRQSLILTIFTIVFAVFFGILGLLLGGFINKKYNQTLEAKEASDGILKDVKELKSWIDNNETLIYKKMQNAELKSVFDRLKEQPEDIGNLFPKLATIKLELKYYQNLEDLFNGFSGDIGKRVLCLRLIYQHFPSRLMYANDPEMRNFFRDYNKEILDGAYESEIIYSTKEMALSVIKIKEEDYKNRYSEYLQELKNQKRLDEKDYMLLKIIYDVFMDKKEELLFQELCSNISLDYENIFNEQVG